MSSLLGALPPLHGRRAAAASSSTHTSLVPPPATPLHSPAPLHKPSSSPPHTSPRSSIRPLRLALRFSPPLLALEYLHLPARVPRSRDFPLDLASKSAAQLTSELQRSHPQYLSAALLPTSQLTAILSRLLTAQTAAPSPLLQLDLNRVDPSVLAAAKEEMGKSFNARLLRPGDPGYEYDKQVEFEEATEPSDWD